MAFSPVSTLAPLQLEVLRAFFAREINGTGVVEITTGRLLETHDTGTFTHGALSGTLMQKRTVAYRMPAAK